MAAESVDQQQDIAANPNVSIKVQRGNVAFVSWDKNSIQVKGELDELSEGFIFDVKDNSVVIEDKLNVVEELEADIALNIEKYQCEWKTTIENPEKMKRFQHYINSEEMDTSLSFIKEREQRFPKPNISASLDSQRDEKLTKADQIEVTEVS